MLKPQKIIFLLFLFVGFSCQKITDEITATSTNNNVLYVATGACNSGQGITTYTTTTATRTIERFSVANGASHGPLFDYINMQSGMPSLMSPASIRDNGSNLYVLNEGGTGQRNLIRMPKATPYSYSTQIANNSTAFNGVLLNFSIDDSGSFLISKSTGIEKFSSASTRLMANGAAWVNAPGGNCATATTSITSVLTLPTSAGVTGHVVFSHQGATAALNRLGIVYGGTGYTTAANCLYGVSISSVTHNKATNLASGTIAFAANGTSPTSMVLVPYTSGTVIAKLIVSYSNNQTYNPVSGTITTLNHGLAVWDVDQASASTATLSNPIVLVEDHTQIFAASAMTYDPTDNSLYVAVGGNLGSANQTTGNLGYNIEKYTLDLTNAQTTGPTLTRVGSQPFIWGGSNTRCISGLAIGQ